MEFSWKIYAAAVSGNFFWILAMFLAQQLDKSLPERHSIIPGTNQKFLHMQDFWTMVWGDIVGVSFIWGAFLHLAIYRFEFRHWIVFTALAVLFMAGFAVMCFGKNHKPDMGYPDIGKISWNGILYLPYFGAGASAAVFCVWLVAIPGLILIIFLSGAVFYLVCFYLETQSGNFEPLRRN
jgi:hypothetical protein